jgi:hypothetical protein
MYHAVDTLHLKECRVWKVLYLTSGTKFLVLPSGTSSLQTLPVCSQLEPLSHLFFAHIAFLSAQIRVAQVHAESTEY